MDDGERATGREKEKAPIVGEESVQTMEGGTQFSASQDRTPTELQDQLLKEARDLAKRSALYQSCLPPPLMAESAVSSSAEELVLEECNQAWRELGEFQDKLTLCDPRPEVQDSENPLAVLFARERVLLAELNVQKNRHPKPLPVNKEVLTCLGKLELQSTGQQLEMILSCVRARKKSLQERLEREQKWLEEQQEIVKSLQDRDEERQTVFHSLSENSALQKMRRDLERLTVLKERLLNALGSFLDAHYPPPSVAEAGGKKKRLAHTGSVSNLITFHEMLERLMTQTMRSPHDPYLELDETYWPPYVEALLRYGVALRHPQDPHRIRLEDFCE
ncbi:centromere protein K [Mobula hypostoma]|uniref:centromere protein K n=1 Tax=Mobula hypostoma TaxID=723540 RepID=UPI002FC33479